MESVRPSKAYSPCARSRTHSKSGISCNENYNTENLAQEVSYHISLFDEAAMPKKSKSRKILQVRHKREKSRKKVKEPSKIIDKKIKK